jgi:hypothetical protein
VGQRGHGNSRRLYLFLWKRIRKPPIWNRIVSAVKRAEFIRDRVSYIVPRSSWCNIVLYVHVLSEEISDDS